MSFIHVSLSMALSIIGVTGLGRLPPDVVRHGVLPFVEMNTPNGDLQSLEQTSQSLRHQVSNRMLPDMQERYRDVINALGFEDNPHDFHIAFPQFVQLWRVQPSVTRYRSPEKWHDAYRQLQGKVVFKLQSEPGKQTGRMEILLAGGVIKQCIVMFSGMDHLNDVITDRAEIIAILKAVNQGEAYEVKKYRLVDAKNSGEIRVSRTYKLELLINGDDPQHLNLPNQNVNNRPLDEMFQTTEVRGITGVPSNVQNNRFLPFFDRSTQEDARDLRSLHRTSRSLRSHISDLMLQDMQVRYRDVIAALGFEYDPLAFHTAFPEFQDNGHAPTTRFRTPNHGQYDTQLQGKLVFRLQSETGQESGRMVIRLADGVIKECSVRFFGKEDIVDVMMDRAKIIAILQTVSSGEVYEVTTNLLHGAGGGQKYQQTTYKLELLRNGDDPEGPTRPNPKLDDQPSDQTALHLQQRYRDVINALGFEDPDAFDEAFPQVEHECGRQPSETRYRIPGEWHVGDPHEARQPQGIVVFQLAPTDEQGTGRIAVRLRGGEIKECSVLFGDSRLSYRIDVDPEEPRYLEEIIGILKGVNDGEQFVHRNHKLELLKN